MPFDDLGGHPRLKLEPKTSLFWKAVPISVLCGAPISTPIVGSLTRFFNQMQYMSVSPMSPIFSQSSTSAPLLMGFFIGNTAGFESSYNFRMISWCKQSFLFVIGRITTTFSFGVPFHCSRDVVIFVRWSWPSFKNGNRS